MTPDEQSRIWHINSRRMRDFFLNYAKAKYMSGELVQHPLPDTPFLEGAERFEMPRERTEDLPPDQNTHPVGAGPDRWGRYEAVEPDYHGTGELFHDPVTGGVYCKVVMPGLSGGWRPGWIRLT